MELSKQIEKYFIDHGFTEGQAGKIKDYYMRYYNKDNGELVIKTVEKIEDVLAFYGSLGLDQVQVRMLLYKFPGLLTINLETARKNVDFMGVLGYDLYAISLIIQRRPDVLLNQGTGVEEKEKIDEIYKFVLAEKEAVEKAIADHNDAKLLK